MAQYFNANQIKKDQLTSIELNNGLDVVLTKLTGGALRAVSEFDGKKLEAEHDAKDMRVKLAEWEQLGVSESEQESGQIIAYVRVSSADQNTQRQDFKGYTIDRVYEEKASAKDANRPELQKMLSELNKGDTVLVHSLDRLARSLTDLRNLTDEMNSKGVSVRFIKEGMDFLAEGKRNKTNNLMLNILGSIAEFERELIKERQAEGIAKAKEKGIYKGRPANARLAAEIKKLLAEGLSTRKIAAHLGCSKNTVTKVSKEMKAAAAE